MIFVTVTSDILFESPDCCLRVYRGSGRPGPGHRAPGPGRSHGRSRAVTVTFPRKSGPGAGGPGLSASGRAQGQQPGPGRPATEPRLATLSLSHGGATWPGAPSRARRHISTRRCDLAQSQWAAAALRQPAGEPSPPASQAASPRPAGPGPAGAGPPGSAHTDDPESVSLTRL